MGFTPSSRAGADVAGEVSTTLLEDASEMGVTEREAATGERCALREEEGGAVRTHEDIASKEASLALSGARAHTPASGTRARGGGG